MKPRYRIRANGRLERLTHDGWVPASPALEMQAAVLSRQFADLRAGVERAVNSPEFQRHLSNIRAAGAALAREFSRIGGAA